MKKYLLGLAMLLLGTAVMTSCSDDNDGPETYLQEYSTGAYVVNSGNMYSKIESLSHSHRLCFKHSHTESIQGG